MRIDVIRRSATVAICSGVLLGFLFGAGCSDRPTSGNKLDDPALKANMKPMWDEFKAKTQEMKDKMNRGSSKGPRRL
jgi:hypothetical protein